MRLPFQQSMADRILDTPRAFAEAFNLTGAQSALSVPWEDLSRASGQNHVAAPHPAVAAMIGDEAKAQSLSRFIVGGDVADVMSAMIKDDPSLRVVEELAAHPPSARGWVEWSRGRLKSNVRFGALWAVDSGHMRAAFFISAPPCTTAMMIGRIPSFASVATIGFDVPVQIVKADYIQKDDAETLMVAAIRFMTCFFAFMALPHSVKRTVIAAPDALQKARRKRGRPFPLLSMNVVDFYPLRPDVIRSEDAKIMSTGMVRLHHVIAHWRRILRDGKQSLTWVTDHWRGDARNGVVLKTREIRP